MYAVPVVVGPYISVIRDVIQELRSHDALIELSDGRGARGILDRVTTRDSALRDLGIRGQNVWLKHRGASKRVLSVITHE
jgi:3-deoxy-D-manno-octulosonic-acid transferase